MPGGIETARADANRSMGYVHKLRLESRELISVEALEVSETPQPSWSWLIGKLVIAVVFALSILWSAMHLI